MQSKRFMAVFCFLILLSLPALGASQYFVPYFSGSVGIGTAAPATFPNWTPDIEERVLTITGSGNASAYSCGVLNLSNNRATATVGDILGGMSFGHFHNSGGNMGAMIASYLEGSGGTNGFGGNLSFWTKNDNALTHTEKMRINNAGNVGIGTNAPAYGLHVEKPLSNSTTLPFNSAFFDSASIAQDVGGGTFYGGKYDATGSNAFFGGIRGGKNNSTAGDSGGYLSLYTHPNGGVVSERLRITSAGNVGIGTTIPNAPLDIHGTTEVGISYVKSGSKDARVSVADPTQAWSAAVGWETAGDFDILQEGVASRLHLKQDGSVGIGTTTPGQLLDVYGGLVRVRGPLSGLQIGRRDTGANAWQMYSAAGKFSLYDNVNLADRVTIDTSGNVGINIQAPVYKLHVVGTAGLSTGTAWANASDARLKDVHGDYEYGLKEVLKLHTVRFNYKKNNALGLPSDYPMTGFIAQEVQKVIPDAVHQSKSGYLDLNVDPIHWAVVNAVKELAHENTGLRRENLAIKTYLCSKDPDAGFCSPKTGP